MWWLYWSCCPLLSSHHSKTICRSQLRSDIKEESARAVAKQPDLPDVAQESGDLTPEQQGQMKTPSSNYVHRIIAFLDRHVHNATHWLQIRDTVIHTRPDMKVLYVKVYIYIWSVCVYVVYHWRCDICMHGLMHTHHLYALQLHWAGYILPLEKLGSSKLIVAHLQVPRTHLQHVRRIYIYIHT